MRGQLTIEYLIILVVMLVLFNAISMDLVQSSLSDTMSTQTLESVKSQRYLISSVVESMRYQASGARSIIYLRAPSECALVVSVNNVALSCDSGSASVNYTGTSLVPSYNGVSYGPAQTIAKGKTGTLQITRV